MFGTLPWASGRLGHQHRMAHGIAEDGKGKTEVAELRFRRDSAHPPEGCLLALHEFAPGVL